LGPSAQISTVYVDNHIMAAVEDKAGKLLQRTARATLQASHSVFPPPSATNSPGAKDPISEKKLHKGGGRWDTRKEILGYMLGGIDRTVQLPTDRADALIKEAVASCAKDGSNSNLFGPSSDTYNTQRGSYWLLKASSRRCTTRSRDCRRPLVSVHTGN
jgi:hypothetical protein